MSEENDVTVKLPHGLSRRIASMVEEEGLGYASFHDFCLEAIRRQLERAERTSYFLREERR